MFRKSYEVVAWTYDADMHCVGCTLNAFPALRSIVNDYAVDSEGNDVTPVFLDQIDDVYTCGTCHGVID